MSANEVVTVLILIAVYVMGYYTGKARQKRRDKALIRGTLSIFINDAIHRNTGESETLTELYDWFAKHLW